MQARILGIGKYLPLRVVENAELEARMGLPAGWIYKRTGIRSRRYVSGEATSDMAAPAARRALEDAGLRPSELDVIIGASAVPEQAIPVSSVFVQHALGITHGAACFDMNATCFSFPVALHHAAMLIDTGQARHVLVYSAEASSLALNFAAPESSVLFGDGAAAVVLGPSGDTKSRFTGFKLRTYSEGRHLAEIPGGGTRNPPSAPGWGPKQWQFAMDGRGIFKAAARLGEGFLDDFFARAGLPQGDVKLAVPHQTSHHGVTIYSRRLGFRPEQVFTNLADHGNCVSASIPMALHDALRAGRAARGEPIVLLGTAAGLTLGALALVY